jgi:Tfp pilus assembly protein PilE
MFNVFKKIRNEKGFHLIRLLIIAAIIGMLAGASITSHLGVQQIAKVKSIIVSIEQQTVQHFQNWKESLTKKNK